MIKMIQFILLLIMQLGTLSSFSQKKNIADFFKEIPENYLNIASSERNLILKSSDAESAIAYNVYYRLDTIDYRNGFLSIHSIGDGAGENYEITYYNLSDENQLIAINHINWAMCCEDSELIFLKYADEKWIDVSKETIKIDVLSEFINDAAILEFIKEDLDGQLIYKLPQKGKNIEVELSETFFFDIYEPPSQGYRFNIKEITDAIKYNRMVLIWDDGTFVSGEKNNTLNDKSE